MSSAAGSTVNSVAMNKHYKARLLPKASLAGRELQYCVVRNHTNGNDVSGTK